MDAPSDAPPICTHVQNLRVLRGTAETFGTDAGRRYAGMICIDGRPEIGCAMTDFEKRFQLCAPATGDFGIRFTQMGFENTVYLHGPGSLLNIEQFSVGDDAYVGPMLWTAIGGPYPTDATHGNLVITIASFDANEVSTGIPNASVATVPSSGVPIVRYFDANNVPDQTLNATSAAGIAVIGNVPVGEYDIQINSSTHPKCTQVTDGFKSPDNSQHARVRIGGATTTVLNMKCTP